MSCPFCGIVAGEPAHRVLSTPDVVAFLDNRPVFPGHVLVIPTTHVGDLAGLADVATFFTAVQRISGAVEEGMGAGGTFVAVNNKVSQSVPHLHCHVVPRTKGDGLRGFFWPRHRYGSDDEAAAIAARIAACT